MKDRIFFDANIICYAYDASEPEKKVICEKLMGKVYSGDITGVISNQTIGEIFNALTTKFDVPLEDAKVIVGALLIPKKWDIIDYTHATARRAIEKIESSNHSFWDFLITETMKENGVTELLTENEKDFKDISGITVTNPLQYLK